MSRASVIGDRIRFRTSLAPLKMPAFAVINALQDSPADVQLEALSLTLSLMCRGVGIDPHELVTRSNKQITEADTVKNPALEAIEAYASGELRQ